MEMDATGVPPSSRVLVMRYQVSEPSGVGRAGRMARPRSAITSGAAVFQLCRVWLIGFRPPRCGFSHCPGRVIVHYAVGRVVPMSCDNVALPFLYRRDRISLTRGSMNSLRAHA